MTVYGIKNHFCEHFQKFVKCESHLFSYGVHYYLKHFYHVSISSKDKLKMYYQKNCTCQRTSFLIILFMILVSRLWWSFFVADHDLGLPVFHSWQPNLTKCIFQYTIGNT